MQREKLMKSKQSKRTKQAHARLVTDFRVGICLSTMFGSSLLSFILPAFLPPPLFYRIFMILVAFVLWNIIYMFVPVHCFELHKHPQQQRMQTVRNYAVSTIHALYAIGAVIMFWRTFGMNLHDFRAIVDTGDIEKGAAFMYPVLLGSVGYFLYDLTDMMRHRHLLTVGSVIHHVMIAGAFIVSTGTGIMAPGHFWLLFEELSTPFLNAKSLLRSQPALANASALLFAIAFYICRIGYGSYLFIGAFGAINDTLAHFSATGDAGKWWQVTLQLVVFAGTRLLNYYWAALIARKVLQTLGIVKTRKNIVVDATVENDTRFDRKAAVHRNSDSEHFANGSVTAKAFSEHSNTGTLAMAKKRKPRRAD